MELITVTVKGLLLLMLGGVVAYGTAIWWMIRRIGADNRRMSEDEEADQWCEIWREWVAGLPVEQRIQIRNGVAVNVKIFREMNQREEWTHDHHD